MKKENLFEKLCAYIKEKEQSNAYVSYTEGDKTIKHAILFRENNDLFIVSNNTNWDGSRPSSDNYLRYGCNSWVIDKSYYSNIIPEINIITVSKEELCEILNVSLDSTIIIKDKKEKTVI